MLIEGHEIPSDLPRDRLWDELLALENISQWSALDKCVSTDSSSLTQTSSYVCTHDNGHIESDANVEVITFVPQTHLGLRTSTAMADLEEHLVIEERDGQCVLVYSVDATSAGFGPSVALWLRLHVNHVCRKLEAFARRQLV